LHLSTAILWTPPFYGHAQQDYKLNMVSTVYSRLSLEGVAEGWWVADLGVQEKVTVCRQAVSPGPPDLLDVALKALQR